MINKETMRIMNDLQDCTATIGTNRAAETLGISPKGFKRYLEGLEKLPDWAIEVTDGGERRTFRILTERFASFLSCSYPFGDDYYDEEDDGGIEKEIIGFVGAK